MKSWLQQHLYAFRVAMRRLTLTPFSSLTNIIVIAFVLALPLLVSAVIVSTVPFTQQVSVNPAISLFMKDATSLQETQALAEKLQQKYPEQIVSAQVVDKQEALDDLKKSPSWAEAIDTLQKNPLPHAIILTLALKPDGTIDAPMIQALVSEITPLEPVDTVQYDSEWLQQLNTLLRFGIVILGLLATGVAIVVIGTVFNTVRMQALVQRDEIAVARLVGATESFVRRPFLYMGALTGLAAGILAIILSAIALAFTNYVITDISQQFNTDFSIHLPQFYWLGFAIVITIILAAIAARWSVTKYSSF
ncbi:cell division protein FtsX [Brackiella oedipodis]|uniref:cell division protein FtsX n=1 Tax=Brackiella oedipodis TaxID=124225 RepID=UPI000490B1CA|nr:ABC transporter permease [Brackiella oedipodis]